ncbi:MAG TPA: hypothetical protein VIV60_14860 [Polyangiaceae bacterium]
MKCTMLTTDKNIAALVWGLAILASAPLAKAADASAPQAAPSETDSSQTPSEMAPQAAPAAAPALSTANAAVPDSVTPPAANPPQPILPQAAPPPRDVPLAQQPATSPNGSVEALPPKDASPFGAKGESAELIPKLNLPIRFDGYFWVDTGYMKRTNAQSGQYDQSAAYMQGRYVLGATYYAEKGNWFGLARGQFIGLVNEFSKSQYEPHTLDAYVQVGLKRKFDIQIGRFLAWEVYHRGQGIELFTAEEAGALNGPTLYWLDQTRGYKNEAGQFALHAYPFDVLKFELAGVYGQDSNQNNYGLRPVVDFSVGGFQAIGGYEYLRQVPQTDADKVEMKLQGAAGKLQYRFPVVTAGANVAYVDVDATDIQGQNDSAKSYKKLSTGGFIDIDFWRNSIGLGYHHTMQKNRRDEQTTHEQMFVSYLLRLPIDGLALKAVYGFASARIEDVDAKSKWTNNMNSFRFRVSYDFK